MHMFIYAAPVYVVCFYSCGCLLGALFYLRFFVDTSRLRCAGITNACFQVGRAEMLLPELRGQFFADDLCAVMNPGRAGLSEGLPRISSISELNAAFGKAFGKQPLGHAVLHCSRCHENSLRTRG